MTEPHRFTAAGVVLQAAAPGLLTPNIHRWMNVKRWVTGLVAVLLIEGLMALVLSFTVMAENCATSPRWQCDAPELLRAGLIAVPALYAALFAIAAMRVWVERRESQAPN